MAHDTTQKLGFAIEAIAETDPITAEGSLYWRFGRRTHQFNDFHPIEKHTWNSIYLRNSRMPTNFELVENPLIKGVSFYPTTTVADYLILGSCSTAVTDIHTITHIDTGHLPTFTVRSESSGGTASRYISAVGCKATSLTGLLICNEGFGYLSNSLTYSGIRTQAAARAAATTGPYYPTTDGTMTSANQLTTVYHKQDGTFAFSWDATDYKNDLINFSYTIQNIQNSYAVDGDPEIEHIDEGNYVVTVSGELWRGSDDQIYTDFLAETHTHDITFTIYNGATNYATRTFSNIALSECEAPYAEGGKPKTWQFHGLAKDYGVVSLDGITDGVGDAVFYGE